MVLSAFLACESYAATIIKANNSDNLNLSTSWVGGTAPGSLDVAQWDNTLPGASTTVLGADLSWQGLRILNPGELVTINSGNTLTLGTSFIDMSTATADLVLNCGVTLGGAQSWTNQLGRSLVVNGSIGGAFVLTKKGEGMLILSGANTHTSTTIGDGASKSGGIIVSNSGALGSGTANLNGTGVAAFWLMGGVIVPNALTANSASGNGITAYGNMRNVSGYNKWTGLISGNASPRISSDSGTLEIATGGFTLGSTSSDRGPNFIGPGDIIVSAPIRKFTSGSRTNTCSHALGTGTLRLSGANTYTGPTTLISGTTMIDFGTVANVLPDSSNLSLQGSTVTLGGGSGIEIVASNSIAGGGSAITRNSGTSTLRVNVITRNAGAPNNF
jgi:autotransporter-associated beta strand protein